MKKILLLCFALLGLPSICLAQTAVRWDTQDYNLYAGDFNGDGLTDILYIAKNPSNPSGIAISNATTGAPTTPWQSWSSNYLGINWASNTYTVIIGDFNGDGKADILLQGQAGANSYLLLTSIEGQVVGVSQTIPSSMLGLTWTSDRQKIIAGAFAGGAQSGLFLQARSPAGTDYVVMPNANGLFTNAPVQSWTDSTGPGGFKWSTQNANVFAGDFNGDGRTDFLVQAKPVFVMIDYDPSFPVPTYAPNSYGIAFAGSGGTFSTGLTQAWSRMTNGVLTNGVDWSPLANTLVVGYFSGSPCAGVLFQAKNSGNTSHLLPASNCQSTGSVFPSSVSAAALSSSIAISGDSTQILVGNYDGSATGEGLFFQTLTSSGTNYISDAITSNSSAATVGSPSAVATLKGAANTGATITYFHNDNSGTPILETDVNGNVVWKENYRPYGDRLNNQLPSSDNSLWFAGKPFDSATGLSYMGARYYEPALGRFVGVDPAGFNPDNFNSFNRYTYANNNLYKFVDKDAHSPIDVAFLVYDLGKLGVNLYKGNEIGGSILDVAIDVIGVASPIPGAGQAIKAVRGVEHGVELARAAEKTAEAAKDAAEGAEVAKAGELPKPPTGPRSVPKSERDPKRYFTPSERAAKRAEQGHECANGCGTKIDQSNSAGHHIDRHADGGPTTPENHAEVCNPCHDNLHSSNGDGQ